MPYVNHKNREQYWKKGDPDQKKHPLSWLMRSLLIFAALLAGFFEHALGGSVRPITIAATAVVVPILLYRRFWSKNWFWITALLLGILQVPLVISIRPWIQQAGPFPMLIMMLVDGLCVIVVVSLIETQIR